jgi:death-on-curing protein
VITNYLTAEWVIDFHANLMSEQGGSGHVLGRDGLARLESALARPEAQAFGEQLYPTLAEKAGVLTQGITVAHAFSDGNKRAALGALLGFLDENGVRPDAAEPDALYDFVMNVTRGELREPAEIAERITALFHLAE